MTKRFFLSKLTALTAAFTALLACRTAVYADGSATIDVPEGVQQGSSVTVYVNVQCDSDIGIISGNLSYDETVLQFVSSDFASGGGGELVIPGAFPDSASSRMTLDFTFNAIAEGDSPVTVSGYVFDSEGTVIAELSASSSVTVGGNLPPEPDEPDEPEEPEETTTTTTAIEETSVPEESKPIETTEAVTEAPEPDLTQPTEEAEPAEADVLTSSKSSSSSKAENERTDLAKKLTVPLLIILVTLIFALIIVTVWIKNRMKKK